MNYSEIIRQKIKNLYLSSPKIGVKKEEKDIFYFLNKYNFEPNLKEGAGKTVSDVSSKSLKEIIQEVKQTPLLFNSLGSTFTKKITEIKEDSGGLYFFGNINPVKIVQLEKEEYVLTIENKAKDIAKKYGLKECYFIFDYENSERRNFIDAMLGLMTIEKELNKIQKLLHIKESYLVGNNILGIELNFRDKEQKGEYNSCNNKIVLNDKENIPLVHEYVHFVDKTSTALLLTGKTTQELFEDKKYSAKDIVNIFNMNNFMKMKHIGILDYFPTRNFNEKFEEEITQNTQLNKIFNQYQESESNNYIKNFKNEMFKWIYKQNILNKDILCKEANKIIDSKDYDSSIFEKENMIHQRIKNYSLMFSVYNKKNKENNFMLFSKSLDFEKWKNNNQKSLFEAEFVTYYQSQKEMLARTIEKHSSKTLKELTNALSTPSFNESTNKEILSIVSSWKTNIDEVLLSRQKNEITEKIKKISKSFYKNEKQIEKIKIMKIF